MGYCICTNQRQSWDGISDLLLEIRTGIKKKITHTHFEWTTGKKSCTKHTLHAILYTLACMHITVCFTRQSDWRKKWNYNIVVFIVNTTTNAVSPVAWFQHINDQNVDMGKRKNHINCRLNCEYISATLMFVYVYRVFH